MTEQTALPICPKTGEPLSPAYKRRVSAKIRKAITLRVTKGLKWDDCAAAANLRPSAVYKALHQPHVAALLDQITKKYELECQEVSRLNKARALEVQRELLEDGSEASKRKMVELLTGESRAAPSISVNLQQNFGGNGYQYVPPGAHVVRIDQEPASASGNSQSPAIDGQAFEITEEPEKR